MSRRPSVSLLWIFNDENSASRRELTPPSGCTRLNPVVGLQISLGNPRVLSCADPILSASLRRKNPVARVSFQAVDNCGGDNRARCARIIRARRPIF